jgi:hypothetical protein
MKLSRYDLMTAKKKAVNTDPLNFYSWFSGIENQGHLSYYKRTLIGGAKCE